MAGIAVPLAPPDRMWIGMRPYEIAAVADLALLRLGVARVTCIAVLSTESRRVWIRVGAHEIAAITGHRTLKEVARYTAAASQKIMAASGMARIAKVSHFGTAAEKWDKTAPQVIEKK